MLNKQGLFSRGSESGANRSPVTPAGNASGFANKSAVSSLTPGQLSGAETTAAAVPSAETKSVPQVKSDTGAGSRLIVGPDVKLRGAEIQDCDTLVVEGRVEATMDSRVIQIAANGAFSGKVGIDVAEIYGHFDGELTARSQLIIHSSGRVSGKIRYGKIFIEEGGELSGDVASLSTENKSSSSIRSPREASAS